MIIRVELTEDLRKRLSRYIDVNRDRQIIGRMAIEEWVTRREGRDKKLQRERLIADQRELLPIIQGLIDSGLIDIKPKPD